MDPSNPFYEPRDPENRQSVRFNPSGWREGEEQTPERPTRSRLATSSTRKSPRTDANKLDAILDTIDGVGWTVPRFLEKLLQLEETKHGESQPIQRSNRHQRVVNSMLSGQTKPYLGSILDLLKRNADNVGFLASDTSIPPGTNMFAPNTPLTQIRNATPAMTTWAIHLVGETTHQEGEVMTERSTGLHLRAKTSNEARAHERITWDTISTLSLKQLEEITAEHAPAMSFILKAYTQKSSSLDTSETVQPNNCVVAVRSYRPQNIGCLNAMMALTFLRSNRASLYPLCRGIWLFAVKAPRTLFRVESRIGQSVAYSTVYTALRAMGRQKIDDLQKAIQSGKHFITVSDNIQTYAKQRVRRIGRENRMITGLGATAIEMEDYDPDAFNLEDIMERQRKQERKTLTAEMILDDIDIDRLHHIATAEFLEVLLAYVPRLSALYRKDINDYIKEHITKNPIPETRRTKITPLATNSANEMHVQGLKEGILDFATTQMGIKDETLNNTASIWSGDGKTFNMFLLLKKLLSPEESEFSSFRWLQPLLKLWHTKWTDLSRVVRTHWGTEDDPSSLASVASIAECPKPTDLRKVDFYDGSHLVTVALDAHILSCWELRLLTQDLNSLFKNDKDIPSFNVLLKHAQTSATIFNHTSLQSVTLTEDVEMFEILPETPLPLPEISPLADTTLANSILFMQNAIWWREVCKAIAQGDPARVWEILKVWTFTFSGSGNPYYSRFLLEMYCNFRWEYGDKLTHAIMMNWLVNLKGRKDQFIEGDLLQEHHNFWLEDMAQHKGNEFDAVFYREVLAMNVNDFLNLKDEMEDQVTLKPRTKKHSDPHLDNELRAVMEHFRTEEVHRYCPGRNKTDPVQDDFEEGMKKLNDGKIEDFIAKTTITSSILKMHSDLSRPTNITPTLDAAMEEMDQSSELQKDTNGPPPNAMLVINGEIYINDTLGESVSF
ncbi:hypothetical protein B0H34DRAFT_794930 [Crassisporium funariophilum]|nr:hypothetical protein B0H34DRAFT_794930 [Crassisporium funariophilum]